MKNVMRGIGEMEDTNLFCLNGYIRIVLGGFSIVSWPGTFSCLRATLLD
jgi:hypothetical protein